MALAPLPRERSLSGPETPNWESPCSSAALSAGCQQATAGSTALNLSCAGFGGSALQPDVSTNACEGGSCWRGRAALPCTGLVQLQRAGGWGTALSCGRHSHLSKADRDVSLKVKLLLLRKSFQEFLMLEAGAASPLPGCPKGHTPGWMAARRGSNPGQSLLSPHPCQPGAHTSSRCLKQPFHYVYILKSYSD